MKHKMKTLYVLLSGLLSPPLNLSFNTFSGPELYFTILMKRLTIRGFAVPNATKERWLEAYADLSRWVKEVYAKRINLFCSYS